VKKLRKALSTLIAAAVAACLLPSADFVRADAWEVGNSDLNIQNGGVMLTAGNDFYFVQDGIFVQSGGDVRALTADKGKNLNLCGGYLYYTVGTELRRLPASGGASETVLRAGAVIDRLYMVNGAPLYLAAGAVYQADKGFASIKRLPSPEAVKGLIPLPYGNIYLTGEPFSYVLWAGTVRLVDNVASACTDSGYLALQTANENYMISLEKLFSGFNIETDLRDFNIHGTVTLAALLSPDDENMISEDNDNRELMCDFQALLDEAGLKSADISLMTADTAGSGAAPAAPVLSEGQKNIVKRARQLTEIVWTPLQDINQWGNYGVFEAETTYTGIPYGQPVNSNGYIGYGVSLEGFASAMLDNTSKLYTSYSTYNKIAPFYSTDCSGYVSYAWGLTSRKTTYSLSDVAEKVGDQSIYSLQVGDCLNETSSHVVLISSLTYDASGTMVGLQVMEQTPVITRVTNYGQGQARSLASFQAYYLNKGYVIYRNPNRDGVTYIPSPVVPLDGERVPGQKESAPKSKTSAFVGGKTVSLSSDTPGAAIYYTLDGSAPTAASTRYSGAVTVYRTTKLRAVAVSGSFPESTILEYTVKVPQAATPSAGVSSGMSSGNLVAAGAQIKLSSVSGATVYYTTDGSEPTASGKIYTSPITLTADTTIKAIAEVPGMTRSGVMTASYRIGRTFTITAGAEAGGSISPSGASLALETGSQTFTITPASGFLVRDVLVDGVSVGAVTSYTFQNIAADHTISTSFKSAAQLPFKDVGQNQWFYDAVGFVYARGLFNGMEETVFAPDLTMTRGMFVTVLGRVAGLPSGLSSGVGLVTAAGVNIRSGPSTDAEIAGFISNKNTLVQVSSASGGWYGVKYAAVTGYIRADLIKVYGGSYTDLAKDQYYSPYAEWAALTGIGAGVAGGGFNASADITREDMCLLLYNYAQFYGKTLPQSVDKAVFSDDHAIGSAAKTAVYALQQAGVINGMGNGTVSPKGTATRAQVAQIFMKFYNVVR
jgi:uncharacterized protein YgiM (DUF1202 family)